MSEEETADLARQAIALAVVEFLAEKAEARKKRLPPSVDVALSVGAGGGKRRPVGLSAENPDFTRALRQAAKDLKQEGLVGKLGKKRPNVAECLLGRKPNEKWCRIAGVPEPGEWTSGLPDPAPPLDRTFGSPDVPKLPLARLPVDRKVVSAIAKGDSHKGATAADLRKVAGDGWESRTFATAKLVRVGGTAKLRFTGGASLDLSGFVPFGVGVAPERLLGLESVGGRVRLAMFVENPAAFSTLVAQYGRVGLFVCLDGYGSRLLADFADRLAFLLGAGTPILVWHDHDMAGILGTGQLCAKSDALTPFFCSKEELASVPSVRFKKADWDKDKEAFWRRSVIEADWASRPDIRPAVELFARTHRTFEQEAVLDGTAQRALDRIVESRATSLPAKVKKALDGLLGLGLRTP